MCAGCGIAIAMNQIAKACPENVAISCATGCLEVTTSIYPLTAWKVPWIHAAFECAPAVASGIESAAKKLGKDMKVISIAGDGGSYDIGLQALSGMFERGHKVTHICVDNECYANCLALSTTVMTKDGLKRITEIKEGDEVFAFDMKARRPVLKRCSGVFDNGVKDVYDIGTLHHVVRATANHPFLVMQGNGMLAWKAVEKLKVGDVVFALKKGKEFATEKIRYIKYTGEEPTLDLRVEGEHNFVADGIVVHNTGIQRSGATPFGAWTTTTPVGKKMSGKKEFSKPIAEIAAAHRIPYVATASVAYPEDLQMKMRKALEMQPSFLLIQTPCPPSWKMDASMSLKAARLAVQSGMWVLYEIEKGRLRISMKPKRVPVNEYLEMQGRFKHLTTEETATIQKHADAEFARLEKIEKAGISF